uniref:HTH CENPB-type domain-containing protein n=1 Tax=Salarias fasciatus TaxID=181472 RepID=A0A672FP09_SALFA
IHTSPCGMSFCFQVSKSQKVIRGLNYYIGPTIGRYFIPEIERGHLEQRGSKGRKVSKQQRRSFDAKFKLMAIKAAEATNNCQAAKKYGVTEGHVRKWRVQKERLKNANTMRKAFRGPKSGRFREIERRVREYVIEKRKEGMPISRAMIQLKARELADEFKIPPTEFKASLGWCKRMIRRSGLVLRHRTRRTSRTSLVQCLPSDFKEKLLSCQRYVHELRKKHHYPLDQMGYAGQTPVHFDMPSPVTVEKKGKVPVKSTDNEKNRITVMLACLADGTKLPPYVVLQGKTIPEEPTPPGIIVRAQEMGWIGTELMVDWLKAVWGRRRGWLRKTRNMLMLDAFRGPLTEPVEKQLRSMNGDLVIIPGGMTNQLEVLDVVVNKPFKDTLHKKYTEWLPSADQAPTPTGGIQQPAVPLLCEWVLQAWDAVSSESIINGFKKFCASNAMDGSEDDVLWEEVLLPGGVCVELWQCEKPVFSYFLEDSAQLLLTSI